MRLLRPFLFAAVLLPTVIPLASAQDPEVPPGTRAAIVQTVADYDLALRNRDPALFDQAFEGELLLDAMLKVLPQPPASLSQAGPRQEFIRGFTQGFLQTGPDRAWDRHRVQRIVLKPEDGRAEAYVWGVGGMLASESVRFSLSESDGRWRIHDFEDLDLGVPAHVLLSVVLGEGASDDMRQASTLIPGVAQALGAGDLDAAWESVSILESLDLPQDFALVVLLQRGAVELGSGQWEDSIESANQALGEQPGNPAATYLKAWAQFALDRYEDALADAVLYQQAVGTSPSGCELQGDCLRYLDRGDEALEVYRTGLQIDAGSAENLAGLSMLASEDETRAAALKALEIQPERFPEVLGLLQDEAEEEIVLRLALLWRQQAKDEDEAFLAEEVLADAYAALGNSEKAAEGYWRLVQTASAEDVEFYIDEFLFHIASTEDPLEGYRRIEDKPYAFEMLADNLIAGEDVDHLRALVTLHAADFPQDEWLGYYRATTQQMDGDLEAAATTFAQTAKTIQDEDILSYLRSAQRGLYYHVGWIDRAFAELPDRGDLFDDFVGRALYEEDLEVLESCVKGIGDPVPHAALIQAARLALSGKAKQADTAFAEAGALPEDSPLLYSLEDLRFRIALRAERFERALALAQQSTDRDGDPYYEVMAYGMLGKHDQAVATMNTCFDEQGYTPYEFAEEEGFGDILLTHPAYAQIRDEWGMDED